MLLEDKMTKRHKFTRKENLNRRRVNKDVSAREGERERARSQDLKTLFFQFRGGASAWLWRDYFLDLMFTSQTQSNNRNL